VNGVVVRSTHSTCHLNPTNHFIGKGENNGKSYSSNYYYQVNAIAYGSAPVHCV
jgi:hypothetical protein